MKRRQIPPFGHWDYYDDLPITQYFDSAWQAGLIRSHFWAEDDDLFKMPAPLQPAYRHPNHHQKVKKVGGGGGEQQQGKEQQRKLGRGCHATTQQTAGRPRAPKAVDEDLYKIPPEQLYQKPKRKRSLRSLLSGCLSLNCIP